jgi:nucleoid DNA-binding protein
MTKRDLVLKITAETGLQQNDVMSVVQKTFDYLGDEFAAGRSIELRGFGIFEIQTRKSRVGRNPHKPEDTCVIPERKVVKFRSGKELKARLLRLK